MLSHLLTGLLVLPLVGALAILVTRDDTAAGRSNIRWIALATTVVTFLVSLVAWGRFDPANPAFQLVEEGAWLSETIRFKLGSTASRCPSSC